MAAPSVDAGTYDLVIDPSNLWLTIHESVGHATELDRALGYEAAYAGTSFATFDKLGTLRYGSPVMHVTGDRTTPHGLATVGYDDEGVAAQSFDIVRDGVLVGYQLDRRMAAENGLGRSNGCAFADSPLHVPIQRMANVSLAPAPGAGPSTEELISGVERGIYVVGDKSWSIDMQRYNFQFTGQRFYRIDGGRLAGQLRDVAYQATTTEFWGSLEAVGGDLDLCARRRLQLRQGPAPPGGPGEPRLSLRAVPGHQRPERPGRGGPMSDGDRLPAAAEVVERALSPSGGTGCVVIVAEGSEADVRFANNTTTTNGVRRDRRVTVVSFVAAAIRIRLGVRWGRRRGRGVAVGVASRSGAVDVAELVRASEADAEGAAPADDAMPLVSGVPETPAFDGPPAMTDLSALDGVVRQLGRRLRPGPRRRTRPGRIRHPPRGDRPTWVRARGCACATRSPPALSSWWPAAPTGPVRPGPGRGRRGSTTSRSTPSTSGSSGASPGPSAASISPPGATRRSFPLTPSPISWSCSPRRCPGATPRTAAAHSRRPEAGPV